MFLALIETQGNQKYIFGTNRQGANVGASQLLHEACTKWTLNACDLDGEFATLEQRANALRSQTCVREQVRDGIYIVVATSGRAVLLSESRSNLESVITNVTLRALRESPGMSVAGAIVDFDYEKPDSMPKALHEASTKLSNNIRATTPTEARFLRLPPIADCAVSTFPAQCRGKKGDKEELQSKVVNAQAKARDRAKGRISESAGSSESGQTTATTVDEIGSPWIAVIHADGNGIGKIFTNLAKYLPPEIELYILGYQAFSLALEKATEHALLETMRHVITKINLEGIGKNGSDPIVYPIVLGGDDITVIARADIALEFAKTYLQKFETGSEEAAKVLKKHARPQKCESIPERFTASAGIAFVKSHYPFFAAYELSEQLLKSAKKTKPEPALDFHVLHDSNGSDLSTIRRRRKADEVDLFGGPYLVTQTKSAGTYRMLDELWDLVETLRSSGDTLPRGQIRELRAALTEGVAIAEAQLSNMNYLYPANAPLFTKLADLDRAENGAIRSSWLHDIIDCVDMIQKNAPPTKKSKIRVSVP